MTSLDQRIAFLGKFNPKFVIRYPCQSSPILPFGFLFSILLSSCFFGFVFCYQCTLLFGEIQFLRVTRGGGGGGGGGGASTSQTIALKAANEVTLLTKRFLGCTQMGKHLLWKNIASGNISRKQNLLSQQMWGKVLSRLQWGHQYIVISCLLPKVISTMIAKFPFSFPTYLEGRSK